MRKSDDELKLDINEIFGDDWAKVANSQPTDVSSLPVEPVEPEVVALESDMKFNDTSHPPAAEPMVIVVKSDLNGFDFAAGADETGPVEAQGDVFDEKVEGDVVEGEVSSVIVQQGKGGKSFEVQDFLNAYDHFREIFLDELIDLAGPRKTAIMLVKTFEAAREKHPEVFRNANWDINGNLLEDGSLNAQRMLDNKNALDAKQADIILDTALVFLLNLRLRAVEKGLGPDFSNKIRMRLKKWTAEESQKTECGKDDLRIMRRLDHYLL